MTDSIDQNHVYTQADILNAILDLKNRCCTSIRSAVKAYCIPFTTLRDRMTGHNSRAVSYQHEQILSSAEEKTLSRWITRLTRTGFPATSLD